MPSKRKQYSWLSPIVIACCKSKDGTTKARRYRFLKWSERKKLTTPYLELKKIQ